MTEETVSAQEIEAKQLDVLTGPDDPGIVTITTLEGETRTFKIETFSTYKTAQVLKMLATVKDKVNIIELIGEMIALAAPSTRLLCPHCSKPYSSAEDEMLDEAAGRVGCNGCGNPYELKDAIQDTAPGATKVAAAFSAIPKLLEFAPELLVDFAALSIISNKELEEAFDSAGGIAALRKANKKFLEFHCDSGTPLRLLNAYLPAIGLDFMIAGLKGLDKGVTKLLTPLTGK